MAKVEREITDKKLEKYLNISETALKSVQALDKHGETCIDMAQRYVDDAKHYRDKGDIVTAFAAVNYAHGWLDSGARCGHIKVLAHKEFFTID